MKKFNTLKGIPANLPMINVDTDMIIPKQFLKTIKRTGLGKNLFFEMRYDEEGKKNEDIEVSDEIFSLKPNKSIYDSGDTNAQLSMFPEESLFLDELRSLNLNEITPLQALNYLHELTERLKK